MWGDHQAGERQGLTYDLHGYFYLIIRRQQTTLLFESSLKLTGDDGGVRPLWAHFVDQRGKAELRELFLPGYKMARMVSIW
jgi:hypothetical protein